MAVVEASDFALSGWAAVARAVDLLRPDVPSVGLNARFAEAVEQLDFYGNNAYSPGWGRDRAKDILDGLRQDAPLDRDLILSALLARGASLTALEALENLIRSVEGSR
ncbi:hypothetical protein [Streptomyces fradiae]|uniref:hypothetical protein n=1 Tax=Streptomyces fradiae TaxID=1906 RepID=UPI0039874F89